MKTFELKKSTNLKEAKYDEESKTLFVEFVHGGKYEFYNVPEEVYTKLIEAPSAGSYFFFNIRRKYQYKRILG